jgi:hypothetical protein
MNMVKFERVNFLRASLSAEEVHLYSFKGFLCRWDRRQFSNEEIPILIEDAAFLGHVTNARLIIELVADQIGYLSFDFADMDYLGVYGVTACWPVIKDNMNGRNPAFLPHSLYRITAYTGAIVGLPAVAEFAEVIRERGVRIVTNASHET